MKARRVRGLTGVVLAIATTLALSACGIPANDEVQRIDPKHVPAHLLDPTLPTPPASPTGR